jgi:hypothetical protein
MHKLRATNGIMYKRGFQSKEFVRRKVKTVFVEHLRAFKNNKPADSAVAHHMLYKVDRPRNYKHNFDHICLKLLKRVVEPYKLDAFESIYIQRDTTGKFMNF